jgi:hypothetical protein
MPFDIDYVQSARIIDNFLTVFEVLNFSRGISGLRSVRNSPIRLPDKNNCPSLLARPNARPNESTLAMSKYEEQDAGYLLARQKRQMIAEKPKAPLTQPFLHAYVQLLTGYGLSLTDLHDSVALPFEPIDRSILLSRQARFK